jgi:hypothetical protein
MRRIRPVASVAALCLAVAVLTMVFGGAEPVPAVASPAPAHAIPMAVLGDSNSHSYQDDLWFLPGSGQRGGDFHAATFQWTEVLARLRGAEIDLGPWVEWGRPGWAARLGDVLGAPPGRVPRKQDYLYNFAVSGAVCGHLTSGVQRQARRLVALMDTEPGKWRRGVVVIRIGLNDWAGLMDRQARTPDAADAPETRAVIERCTTHMATAMRTIHAAHPATRIVLVGVANESADPATFERWRSKVETDNLHAALTRFNDALARLARSEPLTMFFDDDAWVRRTWGTRDAQGVPAYATVPIGTTLRVTNTAGDSPDHAILGDHHAGLVYNTLWAQSLVTSLREGLGLALTPITDAEVARFIESLAVKPSPRG